MKPFTNRISFTWLDRFCRLKTSVEARRRASAGDSTIFWELMIVDAAESCTRKAGAVNKASCRRRRANFEYTDAFGEKIVAEPARPGVEQARTDSSRLLLASLGPKAADVEDAAPSDFQREVRLERTPAVGHQQGWCCPPENADLFRVPAALEVPQHDWRPVPYFCCRLR